MRLATPIILIVIAVLIILFVFVPLAFIALGKIENPLAIQPNTSLLDNVSSDKNSPNCTDPKQSLEAHVRDVHLTREDEESSINSDFYKLAINLEEPVVDWQYTNGALPDEVASFVYKDVIVNMLARSSVSKCNTKAGQIFENFHEKTLGVEYFSSTVYMQQGSPIGLTKSVLRNHGKSEINDIDFYWYLLDEEFSNMSSRPIVTIWYSTRVGRIEYWFAFRTLKENENNLNTVAEEVLENTEFRKF